MNDTIKTLDLSTAERVDTTTGQNGYPRHLRVAYTADTMGELRALKEAAEAEGHEVSAIRLHRRDGWALWERDHDHDLDDDRWMGESDNDFTIKLDRSSNLDDEAFSAVCGGGYEVHDASDLFKKAEQVRSLSNELPDPSDLSDGESIVCFIDTGNWCIDYTVNTGQNGYTHDTHHYKSALLIVERQEDED